MKQYLKRRLPNGSLFNIKPFTRWFWDTYSSRVFKEVWRLLEEKIASHPRWQDVQFSTKHLDWKSTFKTPLQSIPWQRLLETQLKKVLHPKQKKTGKFPRWSAIAKVEVQGRICWPKKPTVQTNNWLYIYIIFRGERSWVSYLCFFLKIITQDSQCKSPGHLGRSVPMVRQCHSLDCTAFGWPSSQGMMWPQARARRFETPGCKGSAPRAWPLLIQTPALPENYVG